MRKLVDIQSKKMNYSSFEKQNAKSQARSIEKALSHIKQSFLTESQITYILQLFQQKISVIHSGANEPNHYPFTVAEMQTYFDRALVTLEILMCKLGFE